MKDKKTFVFMNKTTVSMDFKHFYKESIINEKDNLYTVNSKGNLLINGEKMDFIETNEKNSNKILKMNREVEGNGFHVMLKTNITFEKTIKQGEKIVLLEFFPFGIYVDNYELSDIARERDYSEDFFEILNTHSDVEKPMDSSPPTFVLFKFEIDEDTKDFFSYLPIHKRYRPPSYTEDYSKISISQPYVLLIENNEVFIEENHMKKDLYSNNYFLGIKKGGEYLLDKKELEVFIPVGKMNDKKIVNTVTAIITIVPILLFFFL